MAKRASQTRDARTTDRTSARRLGTEVNICGKRRRWTAEQKRQIVAEGLEPGMSAEMVARKHGISTGQFYAWRQQLLLRGALDAGAEAVPNVAGIDATASAPDLEPAIAAPPEPNPPTTAATCPVPPVHWQPDDWIDVPLPGWAWQQGGCARILALSTLLRPDRRSGMPQQSPRHARADCGQAGDRFGESVPASVRPRALRRFRHGDRVDRTEVVASSREEVAQVGASWYCRRPGVRARRSARRVDRCRSNFAAVPIRVIAIAQCPAAPSDPANKAFFRATATPFHAALDNIGIYLQPPVIEEQHLEAGPVPQRVADGVRQRRRVRHAHQCGLSARSATSRRSDGCAAGGRHGGARSGWPRISASIA